MVGLVGDSDAAADVHELEVDADLLVDLPCEREKKLCGVDDVLGVELVRGDHRVEAEARDARRLHLRIVVKELLARKAVLRLLGLADDGVAALQGPGVVTAAENMALKFHGSGCGGARTPVRSTNRLKQKIPMRNVVEVDNRAKFPRLLELLGRRVVRRKHYRLAYVAHLLGKNELCHRRAVAPEVEFLQHLHEVRVRRRLYGEVFAEALVPCKRLLQATRVLADRLRVVDVKRRRPFLRRFLDPRLVKWKLSHFYSRLTWSES